MPKSAPAGSSCTQHYLLATYYTTAVAFCHITSEALPSIGERPACLTDAPERGRMEKLPHVSTSIVDVGKGRNPPALHLPTRRRAKENAR